MYQWGQNPIKDRHKSNSVELSIQNGVLMRRLSLVKEMVAHPRSARMRFVRGPSICGILAAGVTARSAE